MGKHRLIFPQGCYHSRSKYRFRSIRCSYKDSNESNFEILLVNSFNINDLFVYNGSKVWPGAKSIVKKDGSKFLITEKNKINMQLEYGDTVNRHLVNNDYVLFNRQPSLHKLIMMGHRVKVMKGYIQILM